MTLLSLAGVASAASERYACSFSSRCALGSACVADATRFTLSFAADGRVLFARDGEEMVISFHPGLRTGAFSWGTEVWQLRFLNDGGGIAVISPETGPTEETRVMTMHCDPE